MQMYFRPSKQELKMENIDTFLIESQILLAEM